MTVSYEWVIEELAGPDGDDVDIIDVDHADTYAEALTRAAQHTHARIGLVRDDDRTGRSWSYVSGGQLAPYLEDADGRRVCPMPGKWWDQYERATS